MKSMSEIRDDLARYGESHGIQGLEGRIQRGLDPVGVLAVSVTREKIQKIVDLLGANMSDVEELANELHVGGIWENGGKLEAGEDLDVKVWMILVEACLAGRESESELGEGEFLDDVARIGKKLDEAVENSEKFLETAQQNLIHCSEEKFVVEDGVPFSQVDDGFLAAAINGYEAAVVEDSNNLLFVGSNVLDYSVLCDEFGLVKTSIEDRGREVDFYLNENGDELVKVLSPGFCIVFEQRKDIATRIAKTGMQ